MKSAFEAMGGTYRQCGDFFIPEIALPDTLRKLLHGTPLVVLLPELYHKTAFFSTIFLNPIRVRGRLCRYCFYGINGQKIIEE